MAITIDDFDKVWASESPLTPYEFNDAQYKEGWNFVGGTPPSRQMWDAFMKNADEKLKYLYNHEDVPVGFEYFTMNPNIPQGSLPLLGGEYSRETYSALWSWVQEQTGYLKTEAEWQTLSTANNGNVPYYSSGDGSTTFRVPSLHCWIKGSDGSAQLVGSYLAAGLPNIEGEFIADRFGNGGINGEQSGALNFESSNNYQNWAGTNFDTDVSSSKITFDASNSNPIYGNANTVQPESIVGMWLVKAYGTIVDTGQIDEQAYIDDRYNAMKTYVDGKFDSVVAKGTNYVRYDSGLQICWGRLDISPNVATYINLPVAYKDISYNVMVSSSHIGFGASSTVGGDAHTETSIALWNSNDANSDMTVEWKTTGWWK